MAFLVFDFDSFSFCLDYFWSWSCCWASYWIKIWKFFSKSSNLSFLLSLVLKSFKLWCELYLLRWSSYSLCASFTVFYYFYPPNDPFYDYFCHSFSFSLLIYISFSMYYYLSLGSKTAFDDFLDVVEAKYFHGFCELDLNFFKSSGDAVFEFWGSAPSTLFLSSAYVRGICIFLVPEIMVTTLYLSSFDSSLIGVGYMTFLAALPN